MSAPTSAGAASLLGLSAVLSHGDFVHQLNDQQRSMISVNVEITRLMDDGQPRSVECKLVDAYGREHLFVEKVPVVSLEDLDAASAYPRPGSIGCEVIERKFIGGVEVVTINSAIPWGIESVDGEEVFCVRSEQLKETI